MTVSNPSITWINHTTLVTGVKPRQHGVLFNGLLVRGGPTSRRSIEQWRDKADLVRVPTLYDAAHEAGLKTAQVDWVAILNSGTIDHEFLEVPKPRRRDRARDGRRGRGHRGGDAPTSPRARTSPGATTMWTHAATHILETHKPNLLLFHPAQHGRRQSHERPGIVSRAIRRMPMPTGSSATSSRRMERGGTQGDGGHRHRIMALRK